MNRCVVSKELVVTDRNAGEVLALIRAGFSVVWKNGRNGITASPATTVAERPRFRRNRRRANLTPVEVREMVALRAKGCATRTIARKFRLSYSGVRNALIRAGAHKKEEPAK